MKNTFKKISLTLVLIFSLILGSQPALSQSADTFDESCFNDWQTFISSVISYNDFAEYWKDIFVRYNKNVCHYADIENILKQIDAVRDQIKKAFLSCSTQNIISLTEKYYSLEAELFYLRNFIDIPNSEIQKIPEEKVWKLIRKEFVVDKQYFNEEKAKTLFNQFKTKYGSKPDSAYKNCEDASIKKLTEKWNSLVKNLKSLGDPASSSNPAKSVKENWGKATSTPPTGMKGFIQGIENMRLNNIPALKTPDEVYSKLTKDGTKPGGSEPTILDLQETISKTETEFKATVNTTSIKASYEALYKQGGDQLGKDYSAKIQQIINTVTATFDPLIKLKTCTKKSADRQCQ